MPSAQPLWRASRRIDGWVWLLLLAGLAAFAVKCRIVYPIEYIGHADASAYAEMADSLVHGRGLAVDYVSFHFIKYDPGIVRPEDHWPPFYSFLVAPFFLFLGKTAFAAKVPSLLISCLLFPVVGFLLAKRLSGSGVVGFATGLHLLLHPELFAHSLFCASDVTFAFMVCLSVLFAVEGLEDARYFYPMGVTLGLAYYTKGAGLVVIPAFVVFHLICRTRETDRRFIIGLGLAFLTMSPWFLRDLIHFGSPTFSTQQFVAGYAGYLPWENGTYPLYWGENLPSFWSKLARWGIPHVVEKTREFFHQHLWWAFIDINGSPEQFDVRAFVTYFTGIPAAIAIMMLFVSSLLRVRSIRSRLPAALSTLLSPWDDPRLHIVWLVPLFLFGFLSLCWEPISRLAFPATPLIIAAGWTAHHRIAHGLLWWTRHRRMIASALVLILLVLLSRHCVGSIGEAQRLGRWPYGEGGQEWMAVGRWIRENLPGSITMTRNPWELHFYSEEKAVQIPLAGLKDVIKVGRYYGATHLIPDRHRPSLRRWISGEIPGLELVYDRGLRIYEIHYDRLPPPEMVE
jgi:4-amino-4-deoxy-L-arabinose transferase-like glycosyltransferase